MPILVIAHRRSLCAALAEQLTEEGYTVFVAETGLAALHDLLVTRYDTVILDWNLGEISGLSVLRELRIRGIDTPVLVLQTGAAVDDRVLALDGGADDVLSVPYHPDELKARVRRLLRINGGTLPAGQPKIYCLADLTVDCDKQLATRSGKRLMLSGKEYAILEYLIRNQGRAMTAAQIEEGIAAQKGTGGVISVYIHYLRRKIDHGYSVKLLHTVRKGGYVLKAVSGSNYA